MNAQNDTQVPSALNVCETFSSAAWRIHRYEGSLRITHIVEAGRRGARCVEFSLCDGGAYSNHPSLDAATANLLPLVAANVSVKAMRAALKASEVKAPYERSLSMDERVLRAVDVPPSKIEVTGTAIAVESDGRSWALRCLVDRANEPTSIQCDKSGAKIVLGWIRERTAAIVGGLTYQAARRELMDRGVKVHSYCAID